MILHFGILFLRSFQIWRLWWPFSNRWIITPFHGLSILWMIPKRVSHPGGVSSNMYFTHYSRVICGKPGRRSYTGPRLYRHAKTGQPPTPIPHRSSSIFSTKFHPRKIFFSHDRLHQIFPKTISPENFPGFSQKIFSAHAMNARFAIFQKRRIAPFARIPATSPYLMQPTHKNRKLCRSLKKKFVRTLRNFNRKSFQNLFW